jgi:hypothetical protein
MWAYVVSEGLLSVIQATYYVLLWTQSGEENLVLGLLVGFLIVNSAVKWWRVWCWFKVQKW